MPQVRSVRPTAMRMVSWTAAAVTWVLALGLLTACSPSPGRDMQLPLKVPTVEAVPTGKELFVANCAVCHGVGGEGQPGWRVPKEDGTLPPPPLNGEGHTWHHGDGLLYRIVSQGGKIFEDPNYPSFKSAMPAFGDQLSHQEIIAVLTYVKSLWGDKTQGKLSIREVQASVSEKDPFPKEGR